MKNRVTKAHFEIFKTEFLRWQEFFGLKDWGVEFLHQKLDPNTARARIFLNSVGGMATAVLNVSWNEHSTTVLTNDVIRVVAFHECCEMLLHRLEVMIEQRYGLHADDSGEEVHRIIRILENSVFKELRK